MNQTLHRIAWWASMHRVDWLCRLIYRYRCPYPIDGHNSAPACVRAGICGCSNYPRYSGSGEGRP